MHIPFLFLKSQRHFLVKHSLEGTKRIGCGSQVSSSPGGPAGLSASRRVLCSGPVLSSHLVLCGSTGVEYAGPEDRDTSPGPSRRPPMAPAC